MCAQNKLNLTATGDRLNEKLRVNMPAKDLYHDNVKNALIKDGWTITDDLYRIKYGKKDLYIDRGAEKIFAAERGEQKIAIEVKSFLGASEMADLEKALGQYTLYLSLMSRTDPERVLYLAIPNEAMEEIFDEAVGKALLEDGLVRLIGFDKKTEVIVKWIT
jgi:XisH protein